ARQILSLRDDVWRRTDRHLPAIEQDRGIVHARTGSVARGWSDGGWRIEDGGWNATFFDPPSSILHPRACPMISCCKENLPQIITDPPQLLLPGEHGGSYHGEYNPLLTPPPRPSPGDD